MDLHRIVVENRSLPEMEVAEIILAKIYRSRRSRGFIARLQIFKSKGPSIWISLAHNAPSFDTNMLQKVVFDKTA